MVSASSDHVPLGIEPKTLANHIANVKAALAWFSGAADVRRRSAFWPDWAALQTTLGAGSATRPYGIHAVVSGVGIEPHMVQ